MVKLGKTVDDLNEAELRRIVLRFQAILESCRPQSNIIQDLSCLLGEFGIKEWTKRRARKVLRTLLGERRKFLVSCSAGWAKIGYRATIWECTPHPGEGDEPVSLGRGASRSRSQAIRAATLDVLENLRYARQEDAEQLVESWVNGNRRYVLGRLRRMPGFVAAAAALTIEQGLSERERPGFAAAVLLAGEAMAPEPDEFESGSASG